MDFTGYGDIALRSFLSTLLPLLAIYFLPQLLWQFVKNAAHEVYSFVNIGLSRREERRSYKAIDNAIDIVSNAPDVISAFKSDKK